MAEPRRRAEINMSAIPVAGVGGVGLLGVAAIMAAVFPEARLVLLSGAVGGAALGGALILLRRRRGLSRPGGDRPTVLFRDDSAQAQAPREGTVEHVGTQTDQQFAAAR